MPEKLDTFEFTGRANGGRYDWDTLLDGSIYRLTRGTDFDAKPSSFLASARKQAEKRGMKIKEQVESDTSLVFQAIPDSTE